ncbi:MAG TPA: uroporphyrinogen decarboxylase family protein [Flexilinea sp.]|nr:uroporphyrinogen decarboxylase family protein [Flexilinea sp.]
MLKSDQFLPLEFVFNPNWWNKTAGISFDRDFYLNPKKREENDVMMRRILFEKFGEFGFGEENPKPRPIAGSMMVAGGFVIPALLGAEIRFSAAEAPQPLPQIRSKDQIMSFVEPDLLSNWPMNELSDGWDRQQKEYGYLLGDINTDGILNAAYHFYGPDLFADLLEDPDVPVRFMRKIAKIIIQTATYIKNRTGTTSVSVNRMACRLSPSPFIHANCSVQMISPRTYEKNLLPIEQDMAKSISDYGVHHCGVKTEIYAKFYNQIPVCYCEIGWESNPEKCRSFLPNAFLNLRLSPIRMLSCSSSEIKNDVEGLLNSVGDLTNVGVSCINMDFGTPEENILTVSETIERYRTLWKEHHG